MVRSGTKENLKRAAPWVAGIVTQAAVEIALAHQGLLGEYHSAWSPEAGFFTFAGIAGLTTLTGIPPIVIAGWIAGFGIGVTVGSGMGPGVAVAMGTAAALDKETRAKFGQAVRKITRRKN